MPELSLSDWNQFLAGHPDAHILQCGAWGELKSAFGWDAAHVVSGDSGVQILFRKLPLGLTIAYIPKPLSAVIGQQSLLAEIDRVCRSRRAVFLKVEPDAWDDDDLRPAASDWRRSAFIQPPRTIVVDLRGEEDAILARMKQKTRYNIRLAARKGVTVRAWDDVAGFHAMMRVTGGRDGFGVHSLAYYRRAYELF